MCVCMRETEGNREEGLLYLPSLSCAKGEMWPTAEQQCYWPVPCHANSLSQYPMIYGGLKALHVMYPIGFIKLHTTIESDKHCIHKTSLIQAVKILSCTLLYNLRIRHRRQHWTCLVCMFSNERRTYIPRVHMPHRAEASLIHPALAVWSGGWRIRMETAKLQEIITGFVANTFS